MRKRTIRPETICGAMLTMCASTKASSVIECVRRNSIQFQRVGTATAIAAIRRMASTIRCHRFRLAWLADGTGAGGTATAGGGEGGFWIAPGFVGDSMSSARGQGCRHARVDGVGLSPIAYSNLASAVRYAY